MEHTGDPPILFRKPDGYRLVENLYDQTLAGMSIPYESVLVQTSFGKTHIIKSGKPDGRPIILWHGQNANATTWVQWMPALAKKYLVFAVDTIGGLGKSASTRLNRRGLDYGIWACEVIEGLKLSRTNMAGASYGGWLIIKIANVKPEVISSAILLSSAGFSSVSLKMIFKIIQNSLTNDPREIAKKLVKLLSPPDLPPNQFYIDLFEVILRSGFRGEAVAPRLPDSQITKLSAPTQLLFGEYENAFNPHKALDRGRRLLPNLKFAEIIQDTGHSLEHKDPVLVISKLLDFLENHGGD
jgi:pimeloyl-ACP methyl ester carboxylesterase